MTEATTAALPQPWEGVTGTARDSDDLLSLEEEAMPRRRRMVMTALLLRKATLVGNQAPVVTKIFDRMSDPQPGDLVVETTASTAASASCSLIAASGAAPTRNGPCTGPRSRTTMNGSPTITGTSSTGRVSGISSGGKTASS